MVDSGRLVYSRMKWMAIQRAWTISQWRLWDWMSTTLTLVRALMRAMMAQAQWRSEMVAMASERIL